MSVFAGDDEIRNRINKISEVMINIENVTPARIEEAKTKATKVMVLYCDGKATSLSLTLAVSTSVNLELTNMENLKNMDDINRKLREIDEKNREIGEEVDAFVRRFGWMLE